MSKKIIEVEIFDDIAEEVKSVHNAMQILDTTKLTQEAIVTLLRHSTKETKGSIQNVLWGLHNIDRYLK